jgi:hypothetical protein
MELGPNNPFWRPVAPVVIIEPTTPDYEERSLSASPEALVEEPPIEAETSPAIEGVA